MMEVVIVDDGNRLTVYELVERVIPCIIAKHYSENYCTVSGKLVVRGVHRFFKYFNLTRQSIDSMFIIRFQFKVFVICQNTLYKIFI